MPVSMQLVWLLCRQQQNADELLRDLNLQYNKSRQQAITNELLDIVGGTVNS